MAFISKKLQTIGGIFGQNLEIPNIVGGSVRQKLNKKWCIEAWTTASILSSGSWLRTQSVQAIQ